MRNNNRSYVHISLFSMFMFSLSHYLQQQPKIINLKKPPPPGVAPNLAQQALMFGQGNQLVVGQKKTSFF